MGHCAQHWQKNLNQRSCRKIKSKSLTKEDLCSNGAKIRPWPLKRSMATEEQKRESGAGLNWRVTEQSAKTSILVWSVRKTNSNSKQKDLSTQRCYSIIGKGMLSTLAACTKMLHRFVTTWAACIGLLQKLLYLTHSSQTAFTPLLDASVILQSYRFTAVKWNQPINLASCETFALQHTDNSPKNVLGNILMQAVEKTELSWKSSGLFWQWMG